MPEAERTNDGQMPTVRDYHAINSLPPQVRVPKKIATPVKVEGKVWFANERSESAALRAPPAALTRRSPQLGSLI